MSSPGGFLRQVGGQGALLGEMLSQHDFSKVVAQAHEMGDAGLRRMGQRHQGVEDGGHSKTVLPATDHAEPFGGIGTKCLEDPDRHGDIANRAEPDIANIAAS